MEANNWITTEQLIDYLKSNPNEEYEYSRNLGGILSSTHWFKYNLKTDLFGDSTDWFNYSWFTEAEFLECFAGNWWRRDC